MITTYAHVAIGGIRVAVPAGGVRLEDEAAYYGGNPKKVKRLQSVTGMDCRRLCPPGVTTADLCAHAAERLLQDMRIDRASIDALIFLSQSPDYVMPATACTLQHRLGLGTHCAALDVGQGCSGYVYGLWLAGGLLESGAARRVLLLVGDAMPPRDPRNRIIAPVFGDGGSATLVERRDKRYPRMNTSSLQILHDRLKNMSVKQRMDEYELKADRADVIVPAGEIFLTIAAITGAAYIYVPVIGLSDGIIDGLYTKHLADLSGSSRQSTF